MKLFIAGDHYTVELMQRVESFLESKNIAFENLGTSDANNKIALQTIIPAVASEVRNDKQALGILACGTGAGVEIGANKFTGVRASLCVTAKQAEYARTYDNVNILCFGSWHTDDPIPILESWLDAEFDKNEKRTQMIADFDSWR